MTIAKEAISKAPSGRVRRTPVGTRNILTVNNKDENYVYRIVNDVDDGDRVSRFEAAGYEVVKSKDVSVGDKRVEAPTSEGSIARISVGGGQKGVVMRIPRDWYNEDQANKQREVDATEDSITKPSDRDGGYGRTTIKRP